MTDPRLRVHNFAPIKDDVRDGVYRKFVVMRTDGKSEPGAKHHNCPYFVLDLIHDIHAPKALLAYARSCRQTDPGLSRELRATAKWLESFHALGDADLGDGRHSR